MIVVALLAHHFDLIGAIERMQRQLGQMQWWGAILYPLLVAICNLLLLPGGVLRMGSGLFFGLWWGFFLILAGNILGATAAFWLSRWFGRRWVEKRMMTRRKWALLDQAIAREGWKIIFLSQVHPLFPTSLLSYFYGVTRIRFSKCILWIALAQIPGIFLYVYLGTLAQLGIKLFRRQTNPELSEYVVWIGGLALTLIVTVAIGRIALRLLAEAERKAAETTEVSETAPSAASVANVAQINSTRPNGEDAASAVIGEVTTSAPTAKNPKD